MNKRIYMFEGCDRTGKSTFIDFLNKKLKNDGFNVFIFHLMGPTKFKEFSFDNDEKSLIQLSKFNDEYDLLREILKADEKNVIILDRTSFGEYIWTKYWKRTGKYTDYVTSNEFINRHRDLMDMSVYIDFWMSDVETLKNRIKESEEDKKIFSSYDFKIIDNINLVYDLYDDLSEIIKANNIQYIKIDSSQFKTFEIEEKYVNENF